MRAPEELRVALLPTVVSGVSASSCFRPMKILVLCYEYPPIGGGGGRVAQSIAEQMAARGHEVRVQTAALGWRSMRETIRGVEVFRTASGRRVPDTCTVREMGQYCATSFLPTLRHIREWKPDVIHAHFAVPTGALAWAAHRLTGVPYVLTAHLGDVPGGVPEQTDRLVQAHRPARPPHLAATPPRRLRSAPSCRNSPSAPTTAKSCASSMASISAMRRPPPPEPQPAAAPRLRRPLQSAKESALPHRCARALCATARGG